MVFIFYTGWIFKCRELIFGSSRKWIIKPIQLHIMLLPYPRFLIVINNQHDSP